MNKSLVLVVEDDTSVRNLITTTLKAHDYRYLTAPNGQAAILEASSHNPDIVLLDLGLPDIDGIDLLKILRKRMHLPILIISARNNEEEKVTALDLGADDYVTKPFGTNELLARIRTALRHQNVHPETLSVVENNALKIDFDKQLVYKDGREIHLTKNEYRILALMFRELGKVVTYQTLMTEVWGPYSNDSQTLRVNMSNIRKKIETDTLKPEYLITEIGVGYRLRDHRTDDEE